MDACRAPSYLAAASSTRQGLPLTTDGRLSLMSGVQPAAGHPVAHGGEGFDGLAPDAAIMTRAADCSAVQPPCGAGQSILLPQLLIA